MRVFFCAAQTPRLRANPQHLSFIPANPAWAEVFACRLTRGSLQAMPHLAPQLDPDELYRSLNADLQRRIAAIGCSDAHTLKALKSVEIYTLGILGVWAPLALAWYLL